MRFYNFPTPTKFSLLIVLSVITTLTILTININENMNENPFGNNDDPTSDLFHHNHGRWRLLSASQVANFSKLGRILFLDEKRPTSVNAQKTFTILVWKYGPQIHQRHVQRFTKKDHDPFEECSVKNCVLSYKDADAKEADLIIVHLHRLKSTKELPKSGRKSGQVWAFLTDESPHHTFMHSGIDLPEFNGVFNWSMHYRMDADIPVPYGRTTFKDPKQAAREVFNINSWLLRKKLDVTVAIMGSNCASRNHRWEYVRELAKHIKIDTFGKCGTLKCPGHFGKDCPTLSNYMFYLAFENSNCDQYITEKLWWNAYAKEAIPIVLGASKTDYAQLLPPRSYINIEDFATPRDLASYLKYLVNNPTELAQYFQWKQYFQVFNEHGYFQSKSFHYCRACEALNFNDKSPKVYNDLKSYWSVGERCRPPWDA